MKTLANRLFLFTTSALFLGTTAFGQTTLRADVPFAFHIPGGGVDGGNYVVQLQNTATGKMVSLRNNDSHRAALAFATRLLQKPGEAIQPRLVFRCGDAGCALSEIRTPDGVYSVSQGRPGAHQYLASIPLTVQQGN